jgi:hypothetical protein
LALAPKNSKTAATTAAKRPDISLDIAARSGKQPVAFRVESEIDDTAIAIMRSIWNRITRCQEQKMNLF